jgi:hypothetical protein
VWSAGYELEKWFRLAINRVGWDLHTRNVEISRSSKISGTATFLGAGTKSKQLSTLTRINKLGKITIYYSSLYFVQKFEICLVQK